MEERKTRDLSASCDSPSVNPLTRVGTSPTTKISGHLFLPHNFGMKKVLEFSHLPTSNFS